MKIIPVPVIVLLTVLVAAAPVSAGETSAPNARELACGDDLVKKHCTSCHTELRVMTALQAMHNEQGENYEKQLKSIVLRKIRLTNGNISRQDGKKIIDYLSTKWRQEPLSTLSGSVFRTLHRYAADKPHSELS